MNAFNPGRRVLAVLIGEEDIHRISTALPEISILQIPVSEKDWNDHLSPWPAEKVFRKGTDFSGHADSFLKDQVEPVLLEAQKDYSQIFLCGYSLAGLFALYASARIEGIDGVMSREEFQVPDSQHGGGKDHRNKRDSGIAEQARIL